MANYPPYQGYMQMPRPQYNMMDQNYPVIKGRPVSSFEEARASMIDFDGSVFYFPDLANQKIYTKQINMDGTPAIKVYELTAPPAQATEDLVTKEEFNKTISGLLQQIEMLKQQEPAPAQAPLAQDFKF